MRWRLGARTQNRRVFKVSPAFKSNSISSESWAMMNSSSEPEMGVERPAASVGGVVEPESVLPSRLTVGAGTDVAVGAAVGMVASLLLSQAVSAETPISVMTRVVKNKHLEKGLS